MNLSDCYSVPSYEFMPGDTLAKRLIDRDGWPPLTWNERHSMRRYQCRETLLLSACLTVMVGLHSMRGIACDVDKWVGYLHCVVGKRCFIHRDLKSSNILLDENKRAKVSDFGLVRTAPNENHSSVATKCVRTIGYVAPKYVESGRMTTKVDVYSFGIILVELITGRRAIDNELPELSLTKRCRRLLINDNIQIVGIMDPNIELGEEDTHAIDMVGKLAMSCTDDVEKKPTIENAVTVLNSLLQPWEPSRRIDLTMSLLQTLQKWKEGEGISSSSGAA